MPSTQLQGKTRKPRREHQLVQPTLGNHFVSPKRKRMTLKKKQVVLQAFGQKKNDHNSKKNLRHSKAMLKTVARLQRIHSLSSIEITKVRDLRHVPDKSSEVFPDHLDHDFIDHPCTKLDPPPNNERRRHPTNAKTRLYNTWKMLLPDLLDPLIVYLSSSKGRLVPSVTGDITPSCIDPQHDSKTLKILCLYFNREIHL